MSRKRFMKLLMSYGIGRNDATQIALLYNSRDFSYKSAYSDFILNRSIQYSIARLGRAFTKMGTSAAEVRDTFEKFKHEVTKNE